jgi:antitoxin (DNA-binding transcriptional repressor) of toxin-antitoxin stability system
MLLVYFSIMLKLNIHEVKVQLSKCIEMVEAGETIVVCKRNVPVAEIRSVQSKRKLVPVLGSAAGKGKIKKSFTAAMPLTDLRLWEQGDKRDPLRKYSARKKANRR